MEISNYTADEIRLLATKFTVSDVSSAGRVKVQFSQPLKYPLNDSLAGTYTFAKTPPSIAFRIEAWKGILGT